MQNRSIFKRSVRIIFNSIMVFILMTLLLVWYWKDGTKQVCNEFANEVSLNSVLMDKTFKNLLNTKSIKDFFNYEKGYIEVSYRNHKDNSPISTIDWKGIFNDVDYMNYALIYQYLPKYEKEIEGGTVRLEILENIYIGNTRVGLRFIFKRTEQGNIDKNNYILEAECDLRGDILRRIKIK